MTRYCSDDLTLHSVCFPMIDQLLKCVSYSLNLGMVSIRKESNLHRIIPPKMGSKRNTETNLSPLR